MFQRRKPLPQPLFALGTIQLSDKVCWLASKGLIDPLPYVQRHIRGDWGQVSEAERQANGTALERGTPMTSRFPINPGCRWSSSPAKTRARPSCNCPRNGR